MKTLLALILLVGSQLTFAGTAIICHSDGTCEIIITQDNG